MVLATTCFLFVNHLFKANAMEVLLKTLRLSTIGKSKGLNHHAEKPEKTNKQTKNEHDRSSLVLELLSIVLTVIHAAALQSSPLVSLFP